MAVVICAHCSAMIDLDYECDGLFNKEYEYVCATCVEEDVDANGVASEFYADWVEE